MFGLSLDTDHLRAFFAGIALVALVASVGLALERMRIARMTSSLERAETELARHAPERNDVRTAIAEIARYRAFAHDAAAFRRSGTDAAIAIARIGNAIPAHVWLDRLERDDTGYALGGGARTIEAVGRTMLALENLDAASRAELVSLDTPPAGDPNDLRFSARIVRREPADR